MRYSDGRTLTPTAANNLGWQVQWSAVTGRYDIVTQAYSFNGQRIAQRKDGVLTYLHADQVGSTLITTGPSIHQNNSECGKQPMISTYSLVVFRIRCCFPSPARRLDVNTAACGFTTTPHDQTSLGGDSHWYTFGGNAPS